METEKYEKIKYNKEDLKNCTRAYITIIFILAILIAVSIVLMKIKDGSTFVIGIPIAWTIMGIIYIWFINKAKKLSIKFINDRNLMVTNGIKYIGTVTKLEVFSYKRHSEKYKNYANHTTTYYTHHYVVTYIDNLNNEKTITTDNLFEYYEHPEDRKCIVYELDGKAIVDAIEVI